MTRLLLCAVEPAASPGAAPAGAAVARLLRDAGHEVVLLGGSSAREVAATAVQEDVDAVVVLDGGGAEEEDRGTGLRDALGQLGAEDVRVGVFELSAGPEVTGWVASADREVR